MEGVENLVKTTLAEIERMLSTKTVVGEPITVGGNTLIPLICVGFGFGAGGGEGKGEGKGKGEGSGGGTGGGAGVKPVAIVIVSKDGNVRVEPVKGSFASALEKLAETIPQVMEKCCAKWMECKPPASQGGIPGGSSPGAHGEPERFLCN